MLAITRHAVTSTYPDNSVIWRSTWHRDFSKAYWTVIWKSIHDTHKIGAYWTQIPNFEHRERCPKCGTTKSLEHIILQCNIPGQGMVWKKMKQLWQKRHELWPELWNIGRITGCSLANFKDAEGKTLQETNWMYWILISKSVHFIWKLRCKRVREDQKNNGLKKPKYTTDGWLQWTWDSPWTML